MGNLLVGLIIIAGMISGPLLLLNDHPWGWLVAVPSWFMFGYTLAITDE